MGYASFSGLDKVYNAVLAVREKPILVLLEKLRMWFMLRFNNQQRQYLQKWISDVGPKIFGIIEASKKDIYLHALDLAARSCSCRKWDLNGIPCVHAVAAILYRNEDPIDYTNAFYKKDAWSRAYAEIVNPITMLLKVWFEANGSSNL
ncbi:hypothetical protein L484_017369 [Morus notabilis]|uniref:SWIM-type domain-containing protein n=1 Tax=Morus notabilis TaxID=981085 RepID=W9RD29_9ROSA|nr:hypothetical protein L484_017369 [Morus notabilis]